MGRLVDWQPRLIAYLRESVLRPFEDGVHDCALFSAGGCEAMTGQDYAAPYRGRYTTVRGGLRILRRDGFRDHVALAAAHLPEQHISRAAPGDLAVIRSEDGDALGIVQGEGVYILSRDGLAVAPLMAAHTSFKI